MKKYLFGLGLLIVLFIMSTTLHAGGIPIIIGHQENVHKIVDVELTGKNDEKLFLAYKTHSYIFIAGVYIKDDGYVLGTDEGYYPLPEGDDLKYCQTIGLLPKELPQYNIPFMTYIFGYSLWIIFFLIIVYYVGKNVMRKELE